MIEKFLKENMEKLENKMKRLEESSSGKISIKLKLSLQSRIQIKRSKKSGIFSI